MEQKRILLSCGGGGAVLGIVQHLRRSRYFDYQIHVTDTVPDSPVRHFCDGYHVAPKIADPSYPEFALDLCRRHSLDLIIPLISDDVSFYAAKRNDFLALGATPLVSDPEACAIANDKTHCFTFLREHGIAVPHYIEVETLEAFKAAAAELGYPKRPICIKPSRYPNGSGKGFRIIDPSVNISRRMFWELTSELYFVSYESVLDAMEREGSFPPLLVMEYLPYEEYSVYCLCQKGECCYVVPNLRGKLDQMCTKSATIVQNPQIEAIARRICSLIGLDYNVNIQIKYDADRVPKVVEINPRLAGTILLPVAGGVDLIEFANLMALKREFPRDLTIRYGTTINRYTGDLFEFNGSICAV